MNVAEFKNALAQFRSAFYDNQRQASNCFETVCGDLAKLVESLSTNEEAKKAQEVKPDEFEEVKEPKAPLKVVKEVKQKGK